MDKQVDEMDDKIQQWHRSSEMSRKLAEIPGIGPITTTALVASIGDEVMANQVRPWSGKPVMRHALQVRGSD